MSKNMMETEIKAENFKFRVELKNYVNHVSNAITLFVHNHIAKTSNTSVPYINSAICDEIKDSTGLTSKLYDLEVTCFRSIDYIYLNVTGHGKCCNINGSTEVASHPEPIINVHPIYQFNGNKPLALDLDTKLTADLVKKTQEKLKVLEEKIDILESEHKNLSALIADI